MNFSENLYENFNNINSKYDLIAYCYYYLINTVKNQIIFLGEYIEINDNEETDNPNFQILSQFSMSIKKLIKQYPANIDKSELLNLVKSTEKKLKIFGNAVLNNATIPFFILKGLDLYFQDCIYETYENSPLNNYRKDFCLIYVNSTLSIIDKIFISKNYADRIQKNEIRNYFHYFIILETHELPKGFGIPKLVTLPKSENNLEKIVKAKVLKIALIPTSKDKWFEFSIIKGASFKIKYYEDKLENEKKKIVELLNRAIEYKANIIVFPEYICSEEIQTAISETLSQISWSDPERLHELLFVVAGSGWTKDSNNVSCIYDDDGFLLGKVYKYSAYDNHKNGVRYFERLQDPGKEITLIKVPRVGIFQIEICRNVSENEFCSRLAKIFDTQFLLITAWSSSVNIGFKKQIDSIVSSNHRTCTAMSNCCAAFSECQKFRTHIGFVAAPQKSESLIEANFDYITRKKQQCNKSCENGCIFETKFDFNGEAETDIAIQTIFKKRT